MQKSIAQMTNTEQRLEVLLKEKKWEVAFNLVVENYSERLYWHIRKMVLIHDDADDVLQNTFINVWRNMPKYRAEAQFYTWVYRIATNEALAHLKKQKRMAKGDQHSSTVINRLQADVYYNGDDMEKQLMNAVGQLPEKQQVVFRLKYFEEMKYEEMSRILKTSVGALKASYHHASQKVKNHLEQH